MDGLKDINVGVFRCQCEACKYEFEIYRLSDYAYGERLLLTEDGIDYAYLNCFEDKVFDEIDETVKTNLKNKGVAENHYRKYLDEVFSITCDMVNGKMIDSSRISYACPKCKSDNIKEIDAEAYEMRKVFFPFISHETWMHMSSEEGIMHIESVFLQK